MKDEVSKPEQTNKPQPEELPKTKEMSRNDQNNYAQIINQRMYHQGEYYDAPKQS